MKSFGSYISKYLVSFVAFILILLFLNAVVFGLTFQKIVTEDYGDSSPQAMLEMTATAATPEQLSDEAVQNAPTESYLGDLLEHRWSMLLVG